MPASLAHFLYFRPRAWIGLSIQRGDVAYRSSVQRKTQICNHVVPSSGILSCLYETGEKKVKIEIKNNVDFFMD